MRWATRCTHSALPPAPTWRQGPPAGWEASFSGGRRSTGVLLQRAVLALTCSVRAAVSLGEYTL